MNTDYHSPYPDTTFEERFFLALRLNLNQFEFVHIVEAEAWRCITLSPGSVTACKMFLTQQLHVNTGPRLITGEYFTQSLISYQVL